MTLIKTLDASRRRSRMLSEIGDLTRLWRKNYGAELNDSIEVVAVVLASLTNVPTDEVERQKARDFARATLTDHEQKFQLDEAKPQGRA